MTKFHQPLILKQSKYNLDYSPAPAHTHKQQSTSQHTIEATTEALTGETDWESILRKDLSLSDDEEITSSKVLIGTSTNVTKNPDTTKEVNTSPLAILDPRSPKIYPLFQNIINKMSVK